MVMITTLLDRQVNDCRVPVQSLGLPFLLSLLLSALQPTLVWVVIVVMLIVATSALTIHMIIIATI